MDNINIASPMVAHYEDLVKSDEDREDMLQFYYEHVHNHYEDLFRWIIFSAPRLEKEYVEELHQETLLKALEHRHQLRDIEKCKTWLFSIAKNLVNAHYRDMKQRERVVPDDYLSDLVEMVPEQELELDFTLQEVLARSTTKLIMECLNELKPEQRQVIALHHYGGYSFDEICVKLRCNYNTVYSWYRRGLARMRRLLIKKGGFEHEEE